MPHREIINQLQAYLEQLVVGQPHLIQRLLAALLGDGHILVEGAPGLAKTRAIKALAAGLEGVRLKVRFPMQLTL